MKYPLRFFKCSILLFLCSLTNSNVYSQKVSAKDSIEIFNLIKKSNDYMRNDTVTAIQYINKGFQKSQQLKYERGLAFSYDRYGVYYGINNNYTKAIVYFRKSIAIAHKIKDYKLESSSLINLSLKYEGLGDFNNAFKAADDALKITTKIKDSLGMGRSYGALSDAYFQMDGNSINKDNKLKALVYHEKAIDINRRMKDSVSLVHTIAQGSRKYAQTGKLDKAIELLQEAKIIAIKTKQADQINRINSELANCYYFKKDWNRNVAINLEILKDFRKLPNIRYQFPILGNIGETYIIMKKYKQAEPYLQEALQVAKKIEGYDHYQFLYENFTSLYIGLNDYKKAFHYKELAIAYKDSILNREKMKTAEELAVKFETREMSDKNKLLEKENALAKLKAEQEATRKQQILYSAIAIVIFLLIGIAFLYYYFKQRNIINANKNNELKQKLLLTQMNPHFIFNSVDNIQGLIYKKQYDESINYLTKFSKLTRQILENSRQNFIPLNEELNMLDNYLTIQKLLYNNSFTYTIKVDDDIEPESILVLPMLAQPFIENAIKHGLKGRKEGGEVEIHYYIKDKLLYFEVVDNGVGLGNNDTDKKQQSLSTEITKERLFSISNKKDITISTSNITTPDNTILGVKTYFEIPFILNS